MAETANIADFDYIVSYLQFTILLLTLSCRKQGLDFVNVYF